MASRRVRVEPGGAEFETLADESVMDAARRQDFTWPTICKGMGVCTACYVRVVDGGANANAMSSEESDTLDSIYYRNPRAEPGEFRLACQMTARGPITVYKRGVRQRNGEALPRSTRTT